MVTWGYDYRHNTTSAMQYHHKIQTASSSTSSTRSDLDFYRGQTINSAYFRHIPLVWVIDISRYLDKCTGKPTKQNKQNKTSFIKGDIPNSFRRHQSKRKIQRHYMKYCGYEQAKCDSTVQPKEYSWTWNQNTWICTYSSGCRPTGFT